MALGSIAAASSTRRFEHITYHYEKALEWLNEELSQYKRRAAVSCSKACIPFLCVSFRY